MLNPHISRRESLRWTSLALAGGVLGGVFGSSEQNLLAEEEGNDHLAVGTTGTDFSSIARTTRFCLNTSTIQGDKLDIRDSIRIASEAGYDGIEIWLRDVYRYRDSGGNLFELRKRIDDAGLKVESAIAFGAWIVDDEEARNKGLAECARDMEVVRLLGGRRIAAPPTGATERPGLDLDAAGERYRQLLDVGAARDVAAQLEVWGFSKNLNSLKEVLYVCAAAQHPMACVLPDIYHLYKGGSDFSDLAMLPGNRVHVFHVNDYPDVPPRSEINDSFRVYPGDGVAPTRSILRTMWTNGFRGVLSLELFNREYWKQDPAEVAATGLRKMKEMVAEAAV